MMLRFSLYLDLDGDQYLFVCYSSSVSVLNNCPKVCVLHLEELSGILVKKPTLEFNPGLSESDCQGQEPRISISKRLPW